VAIRELDPLFDSAQAPEEASPDRELTLAFQRGDRWAYDLIFRRYSARVQGICRRMLSDPQDAQDAVQETFLRVYQKLPRLNGEYLLGAWITRIATNVCLDQLRSRSRTPSDAAPNDVLEECAEAQPGATPEEALLRSVEGMRVHETLASLSPLHRRAITMRDLEGRDYRDIASTLGVPEARARVLLHRARKGFKKSWTSAGIFLGLPTRLLQRIRRLREPDVASLFDAAGTASHASQAVTANAQHLAASCSQVVSHCGGVVSEKIAAAATAALVGVGVTATGGASMALSTEPRELVKSPMELSRVHTGDMIVNAAGRARDVVAGTMALVGTGLEKATDEVDDGMDTASAGQTAPDASPEDTTQAVEEPAPGVVAPEPSLTGSPGADAGAPVDSNTGGIGPFDTPAVVPDPALPVDPGGFPAPSPQPSAPSGGPLTAPAPETPPQETTAPADAVTPSPAPVGEVPPESGPLSAPAQAGAPGNQADALQAPAPEDPQPSLAPSVDPTPTPAPGLGPAGDALEGSSGEGLLG
jgi:RNA polymerase sigma-70 factor (ECF subfamily)